MDEFPSDVLTEKLAMVKPNASLCVIGSVVVVDGALAVLFALAKYKIKKPDKNSLKTTQRTAVNVLGHLSYMCILIPHLLGPNAGSDMQ